MDMKKLRRKARRWIRKHRRYLRAACAAVLVLVTVLLLMPRDDGDEVRDYEAFLDELGFRESSNRYHIVNRFGYMGRYQMGKLALREAGFMNEDGTWTPLANSYGIYSRDDFLQSKAGQDAAVRAYHARTYYYIQVLGLEKYVGTVYCGVPVTQSGLLAACHLVGVVGIKKGLETGQHVYDGNNVSASVYMELFAGYDVSAVWTD